MLHVQNLHQQIKKTHRRWLSTMDEETTTRNSPTKIPLYIGCAFLFVSVVCLSVGAPMFFTERNKEKTYIEDQCLVQSSSFKVERNCRLDATKSSRVMKCHQAFWVVRYGLNKTEQGEAYGQAHRALEVAITDSEKFSMGQSYRCWYNSERPSQITWHKPSSYASVVLLISCAVTLIIAMIILAIAGVKLRQRPDL